MPLESEFTADGNPLRVSHSGNRYYVQERTGFRAGWLQFALDAVLFGTAAFLLDGKAVLVSMVGAAALNLFVAFNHRRDWYIAR